MHTQLMINVGVLPALSSILTHYKYGVSKDACWAISNITAGNQDQIDSVINANIVPPLILLVSNAKYEIKIEAAWAIANICTGGATHQIQYLVGQGCLKPLCDLLELNVPTVLHMVLDALQSILTLGASMAMDSMTSGNLYAQYVEHAGGMHKIEQIAYYEGDISSKASHILARFFGEGNEESDLGVHSDQPLTLTAPTSSEWQF